MRAGRWSREDDRLAIKGASLGLVDVGYDDAGDDARAGWSAAGEHRGVGAIGGLPVCGLMHACATALQQPEAARLHGELDVLCLAGRVVEAPAAVEQLRVHVG